MPRFSANLGLLFTDRPLIAAIEAAAAAGFDAVEMQFPFGTGAAEVRAALERHRLPLVSINVPPGEGAPSGLAAIEGREAEFDSAFARTLAWARTAGAGAIHVMSGVVPPDRAGPALARYADALTRASALCPDLTLLVEPINAIDRPGYLIDRTDRAVEVLARVNRPNVKLMFDCYHVARAQGDVIARLERLFPLIGHVQFAGVPDRAEPDTGEIAYPAVFQALERLGWSGFVGAEYRPRTTTEQGLGWLKRWR